MTKELHTRIIERIRGEGPIPFSEYMRMALYEPGYGYYVARPTPMGWESDYYTSSDVTYLFAHCMGRQLLQMWEQLKRPTPFIVIEQGAGRGDMARQIIHWAAQEQPDLSRALAYHREDISTGQDALYETTYVGGDDKSSPPTSARVQAHVFLSNELVDAFPVHIVEVRRKTLYEVYIAEQDGRFYELLDKPASSQVARYFDDYKIGWQMFGDGWRAEINMDALQWIGNTADCLKQSDRGSKRHGFVLAIDYGDSARALYSRQRRHGTLACYFQHHLTDKPLVRPGEQDITAHVNFSALIAEGRKHGLRLRALTTQRQWLEATGLYEEMKRVHERDYAAADRERATDRGQVALLQWRLFQQRAAALTDPLGMGNFKVLIMGC